MKLYLTLEENDMMKVDRVIQIESGEYNPKILEVIEDMQDSLKKVKEESDKNFKEIPMFEGTMNQIDDLILEAKRLTINND